MTRLLYVRPLTGEEYAHLNAGLGAADAFTRRRCAILLASARRERPPQIARAVGCGVASVRVAIAAFNARGVAALTLRVGRPPQARRVPGAEGC